MKETIGLEEKLIGAIININVTVEVKLTEFGMKVYKEYRDQLLDFAKQPDLKDFHLKGNILTMPLWEIMYIFGKKMYQGSPACFMKFKIVGV